MLCSHLQRLFTYGFEELKRNPEDCNVLLSEAYQVPVHQRENVAELLFEVRSLPTDFFVLLYFSLPFFLVLVYSLSCFLPAGCSHTQKHNVRGFFAAPEALLATYGSGKTTALVIDFGEHKTDIIPIFEAGTQSMLIDGNIPRCFFGTLL
jgi:actin-related protein